jgi:hypothetical protein
MQAYLQIFFRTFFASQKPGFYLKKRKWESKNEFNQLS